VRNGCPFPVHVWTHSQVLAKPVARRESTRPVLRSGYKWPCLTLHIAPTLDPVVAQFDDREAVTKLQVGVQKQSRQRQNVSHSQLGIQKIALLIAMVGSRSLGPH
jgi:hypothetical protein